MKLIVQRVEEASVCVKERSIGQIGRGLLVFLGIEKGDQKKQVDRLAERLVNLRIFPDQQKASNLSVVDVGGEILVISQFTLCADTSAGRRPSFIKAADPKKAEELYLEFLEELKMISGLKIENGHFGEMMKVSLINDGPATFILEERSNSD